MPDTVDATQNGALQEQEPRAKPVKENLSVRGLFARAKEKYSELARGVKKIAPENLDEGDKQELSQAEQELAALTVKTEIQLQEAPVDTEEKKLQEKQALRKAALRRATERKAARAGKPERPYGFQRTEVNPTTEPEPFDAVLAELEASDFDPEEFYLRREVAGEINPESLRSLTALTYEVELLEADGKVVLITGQPGSGGMEKELVDQRFAAKFSLHTHPIHEGEAYMSVPSITDIFVAGGGKFKADTAHMLVTDVGMSVYQAGKINPITNEPFPPGYDMKYAIPEFLKTKGISLWGNDSSLRNYSKLSQEEKVAVTTEFVEKSGAIAQSATWDETEKIQELMNIVNLQPTPQDTDRSQEQHQGLPEGGNTTDAVSEEQRSVDTLQAQYDEVNKGEGDQALRRIVNPQYLQDAEKTDKERETAYQKRVAALPAPVYEYKTEVGTMREDMMLLCEALEDPMRRGEYDMLVGDDTSGRLPTLVLDKVYKNLYGGDFKTVFIQAGKGAKEEDVKRQVEQRVQGVKENPQKKALVITEYVLQGVSLSKVLDPFIHNNIAYDIAAMDYTPSAISLLFGQDTNNPERSTQLFVGNDTVDYSSIPSIWGKENVTGLTRGNVRSIKSDEEIDMYGRVMTKDAIPLQNRPDVPLRENVIAAREDVAKLADEITQYLQSRTARTDTNTGAVSDLDLAA